MKYLIAILFLSFSTVYAQEIRLGIQTKQEVLNKTNVGLKLQYRSEEFTKNNYSSIIQPNINYRPFNFLKLGTSFRYIIEMKKDTDDEKRKLKSDYRFTTDITLKTKRFDNGIKISNRTRYHAEYMEDKVPEMFFRYRLEFQYELSKQNYPYLSFEPYYSIQEGELNAFRVNCGTEFVLKNGIIEVFTILEFKSKHDELHSSSVIGLSYIF